MLNTGKNGDYSDALYASARTCGGGRSGQAGIKYTVQRPTDGVPAADSLVTTAREIGADLVVIGLDALAGREADHGARQAILLDFCPVVAVKAKR